MRIMKYTSIWYDRNVKCDIFSVILFLYNIDVILGGAFYISNARGIIQYLEIFAHENAKHAIGWHLEDDNNVQSDETSANIGCQQAGYAIIGPITFDEDSYESSDASGNVDFSCQILSLSRSGRVTASMLQMLHIQSFNADK